MIDISNPMVQIDRLDKRFGSLQVLKDLSLRINRQEITAIIGHNGSGKTTLIKIILGLTRADSGRLFIDGQMINADWLYRERIGYMPQVACFPENLTGWEVLNMLKDLRGNPSDIDEELIEAWHMESELNKRIRTLSGGNKQKVSAVIAFLFKQELIILDEPTAGLDPIASSILKDKIISERDKGTTFILTSHIMSEIDSLADNIAFLFDGGVEVIGKKEEILLQSGQNTLERAIAHLMQEAVA